MRYLVCAIKKDIKEFIRGKKNILCLIVLFMIGFMVLGATLIFPDLIEELTIKAPDIISDTQSIEGLMSKLFPSDVAGSIGVFSSDIGVFYTMLISFMCFNMIPSEIKTGKWIIPLNMGYKSYHLLLSKCLVYGCGTTLPVFASYNLYYCIASMKLEVNFELKNAIINSVILSVAMFMIVVSTIMLSVLYKHSIFAALSILIVVMSVPDILTFFSFGRFFPTYILTFVYSSKSTYEEVLIPVIILILCIVVLYIFAEKKIRHIDVSR